MAKGFIPLAKQMDFLWSELQGKEKAGFGKFLTAGVNTPEDYATLWDQTYERSGGVGDAKARGYAGSVYAAMAGGNQNQALISPNAKFTYGYLTNKGMTPQQAAGVTGRLMAESYEEINPDARNTMAGGKGTYGVAQWRGSRMNDLANFAGVDVGGITSLPATTPGGGLLTASEGANMEPINSDKIPPITNGQQTSPQQGGLGGLLSSLKDKATAIDPQTGMTGLQKFASALDPLIMPNMRGGEAIRERGAQRVAAGNVNKTVKWLEDNDYGEVAAILRANPSAASNIMSAIVSNRLNPKNTKTSQIKNFEYWKGLGKTDAEAEALSKVGDMPANPEDELKKKLFGKTGEQFAGFLTAGANASSARRDLDILRQLSELAPSGPLEGRFAEAFPEFNDVAALRQSIVNRVGPTLRAEGSGSTSDIEYAGMISSLGSLRNTPEANMAITSVMIAKAEFDMQRAQIVRQYQSEGGLTFKEANEALSELEANAAIPSQVQSLLNSYSTGSSTTSSPNVKTWNPDIDNGDGTFGGFE